MSPRAVSAADGEARPRAAGILLPLFSLRGSRDWGIGEFGHVPAFCRWLAAAGHSVLQMLPVTEVASGERSPYAALTAFALDPVYLSLDAVEDFAASGGETALPAAARTALARARAGTGIDYDAVRVAKQAALELAFRRFLDSEWRRSSERAHALRTFRTREATWLEDYALFRVLAEERGGVPWPRWEPALRARDPQVLAAARTATEERRLFHVYVQWLAATQWAAARAGANAAGVCLKGDLPFVVARDSADVWVRQAEFRLDVSLGAPPDAFNTAGQDWGLPVYRFDAMAADDYAWLRARTAWTSALFDAVRLDHVVGFYRQYVIAPDGTAGFEPAAEAKQQVLGDRLLRITQEAAAGTQLVGEDLGVVPSFVHASLARFGIPGYRVLRWEADAGVFRDPRTYPACSVATSGTHDTTPLATWWEAEIDAAARRALAAVPVFAALERADADFTPAVHAALLDGLYAAGSALVVIPLPDAYGGRERINVPATTGAANWDYRMPWDVERPAGDAEALGARLAALAARHGRA